MELFRTVGIEAADRADIEANNQALSAAEDARRRADLSVSADSISTGLGGGNSVMTTGDDPVGDRYNRSS